MERSAACPLAQTRDLIQQLEAGSLQADEFFCMVLSLLGSHRTESQLPALVHSLRRNNPTVYSELIDLHDTYFQKEVKSSDTLDYDMQLDLAISLSLQENHLPSQTPFDLNTNFQTQNLCSRISLADAAKPSAIQHTENHQKCAKARPDLGTVPVSVNEHKTTDQQRTFVDLCYGGQPEPEDCVLYTGGGDDLLYLESSGRKTNNAKKHRNRRRKRNTAPSKSPCSMSPALVWFRRDLRIHDNPALITALELGVPIIPVFLWCSNEEAGQSFTLATGGATKYWLHHALWQLNQSLINKFGSHIIFRASESCCKELISIVQETGAGTVLANAVYEPWLKERDDLISETLKKQGVTFNRCHSYCLYEPYSISTEGVGLRGIGSVTHFMSCCKRNCSTPIGDVLEAPTSLPIPSRWPSSMELEGLNLSRMPQRKDGTLIDWAATIRKSWDFSEDGAYKCLTNFLDDGINYYEKESGRADKPYTSHISPYLHFGQISPRTVLQEAYFTKKNVPKFLRKLAWRDLAYWLLVLFPNMPREPVRPAYKSQRWSSDLTHLKAWQKGQTGYPLVDAAMRELWLTGWMNNYMRHVVASFLVAYLHLHWVHGYCWFQDTLVDADVAINAMMWQNGGMSGLDHWNFVMHPVDAAMTCDPYAAYVRKFCPELAGLPDEYIHKPWKCPPSQLRRAGVVLGQNYPNRIIQNLEERREQSLKDVVEVRMKHKEYLDSVSGCDMVPIPDYLLALTLGYSDDEVIKTSMGSFLLPVITRKEFKYKTLDPNAKDNPYNTVLKGYISRKRDETIAYMNEKHFTASTIHEGAQRYERRERTSRIMEGLPQPKDPKNQSRRTPRKDPFTVIPPAYLHLAN
ncbi:deoxyribodipyrimidine photo-lyase isoform X2 [Bombina bombina]|uniref:deoxyribodipyrimidine photo-lyase isoform X2 n=1 Tax=Bombina bombina TaxID=8345 RepID=UPI00235A477D|nr:deoxyribodipyrimidine photo-lyase isoform X2 [Bombina bombina]